MTEPTLYRVYIGPGWVSDPMDVVNDLVDEGVLVPVEPDGFVTVTEDAEWVPRFKAYIAPVPEGRYALVRIGGDDAR